MNQLSRNILLAVATVLPLPSLGEGIALNQVDRPLPTFELASLSGDDWRSDTLDGKPWIVNFWATWCPPCIEELPSMNRAWQRLEGEGIGMLAINAGEGEDAVNLFLDKMDIDFPTLVGNVNTLANWSVRALPTTLVIDADGRVVFEALGPREWDNEALLEQVLSLRD